MHHGKELAQSAAEPPLRTELLFTARFLVGPTVSRGPSPLDERRFVPILSGPFSGPRIRDDALPGGIDWQLVRQDAVTEIEAHYTLKTDDGVLIRTINRGFRHGPLEVMHRLAAGDPVEYYFRAAPVLDAPSGKYEWLNRSLFVSSGARSSGLELLRVYEIL